jgi:hypothetical protein
MTGIRQIQIQLFNISAVIALTEKATSKFSPKDGCKGLTASFLTNMSREGILGLQTACVSNAVDDLFSTIDEKQVNAISESGAAGELFLAQTFRINLFLNDHCFIFYNHSELI